MSLSQSLSAAVSGLTAASRGAQVVATNLANLRTEGFGRRDMSQTSLTGGGVLANAVLRSSTPLITADRRIAQAETQATGTRADFLQSLEGWLGTPGTDGALTTRINAFGAALTAAAAAPSSEASLTGVLDGARGLAAALGDISGRIQQARSTADRSIAADVASLNDSLAQVADLNRSIVKMTASGRDASALVDQRQVLVDRIVEVVPLREVQRENGQIALYSSGGATLLDGQPASFGFSQAGMIAADSGPLSGLTLNGRAVSASEGGVMAGGRMEANFAIRDDLGPAAQRQMDAIARDLMTRMEAADSTRGTAAGLFTDAGQPFDLAREVGLAARLSVNAAVDPARGGDLWRLRAGVGATDPGDSGDSSLLSALAAALDAPQPAASGDFLPGSRSLSGLAAELLSGTATMRLTMESASAVAASRSTTLTALEAESGVDSDREMQLLLMIERAYEANTKVIQAVDGMLASLLEI